MLSNIWYMHEPLSAASVCHRCVLEHEFDTQGGYQSLVVHLHHAATPLHQFCNPLQGEVGFMAAFLPASNASEASVGEVLASLYYCICLHPIGCFERSSFIIGLKSPLAEFRFP